MLALGVVLPVLPKLIESFVGGNTSRAAHIVGVFGTTWALMQFLFSPVVGALSDRFGRRPVILLSNLGLGANYLLMAVAPSLGWLFLGRVLSGITSASISTANAYISDITPPAERAAKFGMMGAAFGIGFVIGPGLGGILGGLDLRRYRWRLLGHLGLLFLAVLNLARVQALVLPLRSGLADAREMGETSSDSTRMRGLYTFCLLNPGSTT